MRPSTEDRCIAALAVVIAVAVSILLVAVALDVMANRDAQLACRSNGGVPIDTDYGWRCVFPTEVR